MSCRKRWFSRTANHRFDVVAVDCGIKHNIIRKLNEKGCNVTVVPYDITAEEVMAFRPDGLFLSNGPGDPTDVQPVIEMVRTLRGRLPIFGICLGHQVISLAYGARTFKMKFGHRGGNHPVKNLETGKVEITSQNHRILWTIPAKASNAAPIGFSASSIIRRVRPVRRTAPICSISLSK